MRWILKPEADVEVFGAWLLSQGYRLTTLQVRAHTSPRAFRWVLGEESVTWVENHPMGVRAVDCDLEKTLRSLPRQSREDIVKAATGTALSEGLRALRELVFLETPAKRPSAELEKAARLWMSHPNPVAAAAARRICSTDNWTI